MMYADDRHTHDIRDINGGVDERHYHESYELRNTPDHNDLAKVANEVHALERKVAELEAQLRAEQLVTQALRRSSLNAVSFVQLLRLEAASLKMSASMMRSDPVRAGINTMLAGLLDDIAENTESEIPK